MWGGLIVDSLWQQVVQVFCRVDVSMKSCSLFDNTLLNDKVENGMNWNVEQANKATHFHCPRGRVCQSEFSKCLFVSVASRVIQYTPKTRQSILNAEFNLRVRISNGTHSLLVSVHNFTCFFQVKITIYLFSPFLCMLFSL